MKRARFTEEQIIGILRENEAGVKAGDLARKHDVSEATIYAWPVMIAMSIALPTKTRISRSWLPSTVRTSTSG